MIKIEDIKEEYLRSFPANKKKEEDDTPSKRREKAYEQRINKGRLSSKDVKFLDERAQAEVVFTNILPKSKRLKKDLEREAEPVLDQYSWRDLDLIAGNVRTPDKNVLNDIKRTQTTAGACAMATQMVNPSTNVEQIRNRQTTTRFLLARPEVAQELEKQVGRVARKEAQGLSLFRKDNALTHKTYAKELRGFYYKKFGLAAANTSPFFLRFIKMRRDFFLHKGIGFFSLMFCLYFLLSLWNPNLDFFLSPCLFHLECKEGMWHQKDQITTLSPDFKNMMFESSPFGFLNKVKYFFWSESIFPGSTWWGVIYHPNQAQMDALRSYLSSFSWENCGEGEIPFDLKKGCIIKESIIKDFKSLFYPAEEETAGFFLRCLPFLVKRLYTFFGLYFWYRAYGVFRRNKATLNFLAEHLVPWQDLLQSLQKVSKIVSAHPELEGCYASSLQATRKLLAGKIGNEDAKRFIRYLKSTNLRNRWYFFTSAGVLLATYKLFQKHKHVLAEAYYELGLLDAQLSVYRLMQEGSTYEGQNRFVFAELKEDHTAPRLLQEGLWPLGLPPEEAVANDVCLDGQAGPRCIILTGPNAGGKSTYILAIAHNAVCAQTYGFVLAKYAEHTMLHKIITYVNPTQNLAEGLSLGEAGMEVLKKHKETLDRFSDKCTMAVVDEILNGTDPKVASNLSFRILKERNEKYPKCVTLLTTHFPQLTKLPKESDLFCNKKVVVTTPSTQEGRKFDYTFKIEDGVSKQNIVLDMLEEKGVL